MFSDIISSIGMGAVTGLAGPIISGISNYKMLQLKNSHDLAMIKAKADLYKLKVDSSITIAANNNAKDVESYEVNALIESIKADKAMFHSEYIDNLQNSKYTKWVAVVITVMFAIVDFLRGLARPAITYYLIGMSTWITYLAYEIMGDSTMTSVQAYDLFRTVVLTIIFMTISCIAWWFGDRKTAKFFDSLYNDGNKAQWQSH